MNTALHVQVVSSDSARGHQSEQAAEINQLVGRILETRFQQHQRSVETLLPVSTSDRAATASAG